jgi:predicted NBD/HSP70 family sugar kinase
MADARSERTDRPSPGSTASLRPANQRRVVELLRGRGEGSITQAEIARTTGLASATVSNIVRALTASGLIETDPGSGRRGTVVRFAPSAGVVAGIDVGHTHLAVAVADLGGRIISETRHPLAPDHAYDEGLVLAASLLQDVLAECGRVIADVRTIGMGLPAPISDDVVRSSAILPGWVGVNAVEVTQARFGCPVHIDNDANLGALAEHRMGVAQGVDDVVFVKVSSGVGAGLIIDGEIFRGAHGSAGEIGHLTLDEQGPLCRCGSRGCLEAYASTGTAITMMAAQLPGASIDDIFKAAHEGNVAALRLLEDAGLHLGWGLATVVNLLNPGIVVVGGDMARAGELLLDSARLGLRRHALADAATTPVVISELGERASMIGATLMAAQRTELISD